jgi:UDP-N-acetylglucosamine 4,6-dehydratase/5-epimerase
MLSGKSILITGGTGSFGQKLAGRLLERHSEIGRLVILSRDELKQYDMAQKWSPVDHANLRYFIGDVRDEKRLRRALEDIDYVVHAAALKQVPAAEYNPFEFIKTNILGAQNLIDAAIEAGVKRVIALSTDKAAAPANLYGATKLCADKLFIAANNIVGKRALRFAVVRYGNVMGSRGSVIPFFLEQRKSGRLPITHADMTRFSITLDEAVEMVLWALEHAVGGELFVPKIPSYRIMDLAQAIGPDCEHPIVGIRPGEKIHEEMIVPADSGTTYDLGDYFAIVSPASAAGRDHYEKCSGAAPVAANFHYHSGNNEHFLTVDELRRLIRENVDPTFKP